MSFVRSLSLSESPETPPLRRAGAHSGIFRKVGEEIANSVQERWRSRKYVGTEEKAIYTRPRLRAVEPRLGSVQGSGHTTCVLLACCAEIDTKSCTYLAFAIRPKVRAHADDVVQASIGALVDQESDEGAKRVDDEAGLDGAVQTAACDEAEWPLPAKADDAHDEIDDL